MTHGRAIVVRADDLVMRMLDGAPAFIRRARGFVPEPIDLGVDGPSVLAAGADLKNTVTLTRGREAFVSQHIGDLDDRETIRFRNETIAHLSSILAITPEFAACDLHPDFHSTRSAEGIGPALRARAASPRPCRGGRGRAWLERAAARRRARRPGLMGRTARRGAAN